MKINQMISRDESLPLLAPNASPNPAASTYVASTDAVSTTGANSPVSIENYQAISAESRSLSDIRLVLLETGQALDVTPLSSSRHDPLAAAPRRALSWPMLDLGFATDDTDTTEHIFVPVGHIALAEGWHVGTSKAAVVLALQAMLNSVPIWLSLRAEMGLSGPPDWSNRRETSRALALTAFADWSRNITDTIYLQGIRPQLHALPNWMQEFLASTATCFLDVILTSPIFFYWQTAVANPHTSLCDIISDNSLKSAYAGAGAMLTGNLIFMNVFYPLNELSIKACKAEHSVWRQVAIGILASLVATTAAWPSEWVRAQMSMPDNAGASAWEILSDAHFSLPKIFRGFSAQLLVAVLGGVFTGLANKYMRHVPEGAPGEQADHSLNEDFSVVSEVSRERPDRLLLRASSWEALPAISGQGFQYDTLRP